MKKALCIAALALLLPACAGQEPGAGNEMNQSEIEEEWRQQPRNIVEAARDGDLEMVRRFLARGADVNGKYGNDISALHRAAENGNAELVEFLIRSGANVNAPGGFPFKLIANQTGGTAEHAIPDAPEYPAGSGEDSFEDIGDCYNGLRSRWLDNAGVTPLHKAAKAGCVQIVQLLLDAGCEINPRDRAGRTPLDLAESKQVEELLRSYGAVSGKELREETDE